MAVNDTNVQSATGVSNGSDFTVDGSGSGTGAVEIGEIGGTGGADIYREVDPDDDSTYEVSVLIDQVSTNWHTQINGLVVSSSENTRIRVNNTSGSSADFYAVGMEVDD
jgi:hypothetical protein